MPRNKQGPGYSYVFRTIHCIRDTSIVGWSQYGINGLLLTY